MSKKKKIGLVSFPQILMLAAFGLTTSLFAPVANGSRMEAVIYFVDLCGLVLFLYCVILVYFINRGKRLITNGPYKYTRHPMYTGLLLMDLRYWYPLPDGKLFYLIQAVFIVCLMMAAYLQEKETIARFGTKAKEYYQRTPRLFFCYLFRKTNGG